MLALMTAAYDNLRPEKFRADLAEKHQVVMLCDDSGQLQGFTTFALLRVDVHGTRIAALYSGDTIIARHCWGQLELFRVYGQVFTTLARQSATPLYWFLLTKGTRTYGLLPLFFQRFYPTYAGPTPAYEQELLDTLAARKFDAAYLKPQGIVRLTPPADCLKPELAEIPAHKREHPHLRFFLERNPGYAQGDELVCLARIAPANFTPLARRFVNGRSGQKF